MDATLNEQVNGKDPYNSPVRAGKWYNYDIYQGNPIPPSGEFKLPEHLYCICSGIKKFTTDFYYSGYFYRFIVSAKFLSFINDNDLLQGEFDYCPVTILSKKLEPLTDQDYCIIRIFRFHDDLVNWEESPKIPKVDAIVNEVYYPDLTLSVPEEKIPNLFFLKNRIFVDSFFCTSSIYQQMVKQQFKGFVLVSLSDYVAEHQYRDEHPMVDTKTAKQRDKLWFSN